MFKRESLKLFALPYKRQKVVTKKEREITAINIIEYYFRFGIAVSNFHAKILMTQ